MNSERDSDDAAELEEGAPTDELYFALGKLVFNFGILEDSMVFALRAALGDTEEARIVVTGLNFRQLTERFGAVHAPFVYEISGERGVAPLTKLLYELNDARNRELHATWGFWADSGHPVRTRQRIHRSSGISFAMESIKPSALLDLAKRMEDASDAVWQVRMDYERQRAREHAREIVDEFNG
jgi:hypothetical protein